MKLRIENRQRFLTLVAMLAVGLFAGDKFILSPLVRSWKARSSRIVELKKSLSHGAFLVDREQSTRERWESMKTNTLPADASAAQNDVLKAFDRWSHDSRISVTSIKPQWKRATDDYMTLECRADASGNLQAITRFLYNLEKDPMGFKLDEVEITARDNEGQQLTLGLTVSGLQLNPVTE